MKDHLDTFMLSGGGGKFFAMQPARSEAKEAKV